MKRVLMVAFHFPPMAGSSGIQRTLRFVQHLPSFGWQPLVLTASAHAYERTSDDLISAVPPGTPVQRAFALDTTRHLSIGGRYIGAMARPDRWMSWRFDAVRQGMRMIRDFRPDAIWSTYPIATAHVIAAELQRRSGLPWLADFRDPMAQDGYPADPLVWQAYQQIEKNAIQNASYSTFTTPGAADEYRIRYPEVATRISVLENGYDEETFVDANALADAALPLIPGSVTLLHSGIVYPSERDPTQLMQALRLLHDRGVIEPGKFKIRFRASVAEELLHGLAAKYGVLQYIETPPPVAYKAALAEMLCADGLLIMQASNCNAQIPAKLYEYLRARRPILCLSDPVGDTALILKNSGVNAIAKIDDVNEIYKLISQFLSHKTSDDLRTFPDDDFVKTASRRYRTAQLSELLNELEIRGLKK